MVEGEAGEGNGRVERSLQNGQFIVASLKVDCLRTRIVLWAQRNRNLRFVGKDNSEALPWVDAYLLDEFTDQVDCEIRETCFTKGYRLASGGNHYSA